VAWHRHYTRFWKESVLYCDHRWPEFINSRIPGLRGITGEGEPRFFNAVTGKRFSFLDGMELGRKIWNLDNAIWSLQGRHRKMVHFSDYIYHVPYTGWGNHAMYYLPGTEKGRWDYIRVNGRHLDKAKFEDFKTTFYRLEGWDTSSGWPKRETLDAMGLNPVAHELEKDKKLGA